MASPRITHGQRERVVLTDLEASFPNFMGHAHLWTEVPERQDPPDFISRGPGATIGLELREWLDGDQMGPAKARESQREQIHRVLSYDWERQYQLTNFRGAFPFPKMKEFPALTSSRCGKNSSPVPLRWTALGPTTMTIGGPILLLRP